MRAAVALMVIPALLRSMRSGTGPPSSGAHRLRYLEEPVSQRGLAVVYVRDDAEISYSFPPYIYTRQLSHIREGLSACCQMSLINSRMTADMAALGACATILLFVERRETVAQHKAAGKRMRQAEKRRVRNKSRKR